MKYLPTILLTLILLSSCGGNPTKGPCIIELNGDSIMSGIGIDTFAKSISMLRPNFIVIDKAVEGLSASYLYNGYTTVWVGGPVSLIGPQPPFAEIVRTADVVLIELGANDAYGNLDPIVTMLQLENMVNMLLDEGRTPVLTGIVFITVHSNGVFDQAVIDRMRTLDGRIHTLAAKYNILDAMWSTVPGSGDTIDGIHRTQQSADKLIARTVDILDQVCNR